MTGDNLRWMPYLPAGWHPLYRELTSALADIDPAIEVSQAKQKLGWLRVYLEKADPRADRLIKAAEMRSRTTCELCGGKGELRIDETGWHRTLCDEDGVGFRPARIGRHKTIPMSALPPNIQANAADLPWPLFTLEFEASGLGEFTYPIEIGIARWMGRDTEIDVWSVLIRPTRTWRRHRVWNPESAKIHGITRYELEQGVSPRWALEHANALVGDHVVYCDGGERDLRCLRHLVHAAHVRPSFELTDWDTICDSLSPDQRAEMERWKVQEAVRHRAGEDAVRHMMSLAAALGKGVGRY